MEIYFSEKILKRSSGQHDQPKSNLVNLTTPPWLSCISEFLSCTGGGNEISAQVRGSSTI